MYHTLYKKGREDPVDRVKSFVDGMSMQEAFKLLKVIPDFKTDPATPVLFIISDSYP